MKFGLKENIITDICNVFSRFSEIEKVVIYGSRAKGNYKNGSDIDLTLFGNKIKYSILSKIDLQLYELYLPYTFINLQKYEILLKKTHCVSSVLIYRM